MTEPNPGSVRSPSPIGGIVAPSSGASARSIQSLRWAAHIVPPAIIFVLLILLWEYGIKWLHIPVYTLPPPSKILHTIPTLDQLKTDTYITTVQEALPGFLIGSCLGFLAATLAAHSSFVARGLIPYAVVSNSIPIIGMAPIAVAVFGSSWQSKAVIVAVLAFFPMLINAYRGLTAIDPLSLQLMRSYAAGNWTTFIKLRLPASLPYVFNALKINTTLAMIGAIIAEYFGLPSGGLGHFINDSSGTFSYPELWAAVVVACAISIGAYLALVILERFFTSWHISYRSER